MRSRCRAAAAPSRRPLPWSSSWAEYLGQGVADGIRDAIDLVRCGDESRTQAQSVVESVERAIRGADQHSSGEAFRNAPLHPLFLRRLAGLAGLHELRAAEQAQAAHVAYPRVPLLQVLEVTDQGLSHRRGVL